MVHFAFEGMRVSMGIVTGRLPDGCPPSGSAMMNTADGMLQDIFLKRAVHCTDVVTLRPIPPAICHACSGGQVLMCGSTFKAVQHMTEELGCVTHEGTRFKKLRSHPWWDPMTIMRCEDGRVNLGEGH